MSDTSTSPTADQADSHDEPDRVDVVILGGGSAGEKLAHTLAGRGRSVVVVERRLVGGECPFFACMPSKSMLLGAELRVQVGHAHRIGAVARPVQTGDGATAFTAAAAQRDEIAEHHDDSAHAKDLVDAGVRLVRGSGRLVRPGVVEVEVDHDTTTIAHGALVIATGSSPVVPPVDGLGEARSTGRVWDFEDAWTAVDRPDSLLIVGGGAVGAEIAQTYARFGSQVTLADRSTLLPSTAEPEVSAGLAAVLRDDGVTVQEHTELSAIEVDDDGRLVCVLGDHDPLAVDRLVLAAGMRPNLDGLGLDVLGLDPDELELDDHCRVVGHESVLVIGDANGRAPFTHTANHEAEMVADLLTGRTTEPVDPDLAPRAVYTSPQVASVGRTAEQARADGVDVVRTVFDLGDTARGFVDHQRAGTLVLVADRATRALVGAALLAPAAGESITEFALAIAERVPVDRLVRLIHPFPTWSEGFDTALRQLRDALDGAPDSS